jgi:hypothetical protein
VLPQPCLSVLTTRYLPRFWVYLIRTVHWGYVGYRHVRSQHFGTCSEGRIINNEIPLDKGRSRVYYPRRKFSSFRNRENWSERYLWCEITRKNAVGGWKGVLHCGVQSVITHSSNTIFGIFHRVRVINLHVHFCKQHPSLLQKRSQTYTSCSRESWYSS